MAKKTTKKTTKRTTGKTISIGGRNVRSGSKAEAKYKAQGFTALKGRAGEQARAQRSSYLKSINDPRSANYINPETGLNEPGPDAALPDPSEIGVPPTLAGSQDQIDTTQPSPKTVDATPFTGAAQPLRGIQSPDAFGTSATASRVRSALGSANQGLSRFQSAHLAARASGAPAPQDAGSALTQMERFAPPPSAPAMSEETNAMFQPDVDPFWEQFSMDMKEYFSPPVQRESLLSEYNRLQKQSGLDKIDDQMLNLENIIEGTDEDIRDEITKAGGFGTESQIAAMTNARNKQLIKNYNKLVDLKATKENHLNTMMTLAQQDRQMASQEANNRFTMGMQMMQYRDSFLDKARSKAESVINAMGGFKNFYDAYADDPYALRKAENALGFSPGQLAKVAAAPMSEDAKLDLEAKRLNVQRLRGELGGGDADRMLTIAETKEFGVPFGTKLSDVMGKSVGTGISPGLQKENEGDYQFAKLARDNALAVIKKATGKSDLSELTIDDVKKLDDTQALVISRALDTTTNPKSAKASGAADALGPTGWWQKAVTSPLRQTFTGRKYSPDSLLKGIQTMESNFQTIQGNYVQGGGGFEAPDGSGDIIILEDEE